MATREEKLKKINDELELLSDEQLDEIAGGVDVIFRMASAGGNAELANAQIVRMASEDHTKIIR